MNVKEIYEQAREQLSVNVESMNALRIIHYSIMRVKILNEDREEKAYTAEFDFSELSFLFHGFYNTPEKMDKLVEELAGCMVKINNEGNVQEVSLYKDVHYSNEVLYVTFSDEIGPNMEYPDGNA